MSYPGLVAYTNHAQSDGKQFSDQIIFFVVESRSSEMGDCLILHQGLSVALFLKAAIAYPRLMWDNLPPDTGDAPVAEPAAMPVEARA